MKIKSIVYGLGGFDKTKEDNNVIEIIYYTDAELIELEKEEQKLIAKNLLLEKLGITADEAKLLLE